jgi:hypothetical protein
MIDLGLFTLQPGLGEEARWRCWPKRVLKYRKLFSDRKQVATKKGDVATALKIARNCFGGPWTVPGAIMLLSLQPRYMDDSVISEGFKAWLSGMFRLLLFDLHSPIPVETITY